MDSSDSDDDSPFVSSTPAPTGRFGQTEIEGFLLRRGLHAHRWKRRYYVLQDTELRYYKNPEDEKPKGTITLDGATLSHAPEDKYSKRFVFEILCTENDKSVVFPLKAEGGKQLKDWLSAVGKAILRLRRKKQKERRAQMDSGGLTASERLLSSPTSGPGQDPTDIEMDMAAQSNTAAAASARGGGSRRSRSHTYTTTAPAKQSFYLRRSEAEEYDELPDGEIPWEHRKKQSSRCPQCCCSIM